MLPAYRSEARNFWRAAGVFRGVRPLLRLLAPVLLTTTGVAVAQNSPAPSAALQHAPASRIQVFTPASGARAAASPFKRSLHTELSVDAAAANWTSTGLSVLAGDTLTFSATGAITLGGHTLTPDGALRGWRDMLRRFPVDAANAGALVGRIGDSAATVPFTVGTQLTMAASESGTLFLRMNASSDAPAEGTVQVDIHLAPAGAAAAAGSPVTAAPSAANLFTTIKPSTLDALPRRVADRDGTPGDAINLALIGTEQQVRDAFARAGWVQVDANAQAALLHGLLNTLQHKPYVEVPMSTLYLFGRPQDLSFARASAITVATERNHLRCWSSGISVGGVPLWVGAATHDIGLERDERNGKMTHRIAPEIDKERDFLRDSFQESGAAAAIAYFTPRNPIREAHTATGGSFSTDGRLLLMQLR